MLSDAGEVHVRLNAGEGLCNPRVGRRFRRLLPCVLEMDGDGGLWTVDGASASSMARVTCREEHLKDPERHLMNRSGFGGDFWPWKRGWKHAE